MCRRIVSIWAGIVIGPMSESASTPTLSAVAFSTSFATNASWTGVDDVDALDADAGLAGVGQAAPGRGGGGGIEVGVRVDDHRVLAAALEQHRGERVGARPP